MSQEQVKKPGRWERIKGFVSRSPRIKSAWQRMHKEGGFIPLLNIDDLEARRAEIRSILDEIEKDFLELRSPEKIGELTPEKIRDFKRKMNNRVFAMFFTAGSPWYRGLDNRELARKVKAYLELWNYVGDLDAFVDDVFMCSMQLLNLSWQALDVTNTPPYILETHTVIQPETKRVKLGEEVKEY